MNYLLISYSFFLNDLKSPETDWFAKSYWQKIAVITIKERT